MPRRPGTNTNERTKFRPGSRKAPSGAHHDQPAVRKGAPAQAANLNTLREDIRYAFSG